MAMDGFVHVAETSRCCKHGTVSFHIHVYRSGQGGVVKHMQVVNIEMIKRGK